MAVEVQGRKGACRYLAFGLLTFLTFLISTSMAVTAFGGELEDAYAAYERGDYATAYRLIKSLAEQGNAKAQFNLGLMYKKGEGVPQDYTETMKWYRKAAEQDLADAQYNLGVMYHEGEGVPQEYTEAMKWFQKAAEQEYAKAQYNLGVMYHEGEGVPQDYTETMKWSRKAAEQGLADAQYFLGVMYGKGQGVPQDNVLAYMWISLAASRFSASEGNKRGMAAINSEVIASQMTPEEIAEAQRLAREWKPNKEGK
jgi:TPR repeat protein